MTEKYEMFLTVWSEDAYGVVHAGIVTSEHNIPGTNIMVPEMKASYIASKTVADREITYGSVMHTIDETARPIYRVKRLLREKHEIQMTEGRYTNRVIALGGGNKSYGLPPGDATVISLHRQEEMIKDALLLAGMHARTLLEDFSGTGNVRVPIYDHEDNKVDSVSLSDIYNTLAHYRYCVISGPFLHDVFSRKGQLGPDDFAGTKMRINEVFDTTIDFLGNVKIRDFVGVLRGRLERLSIHSERRDAIFAVQNVQVIGRIMLERVTQNDAAPEFIQFLRSRVLKDEGRQMHEAEFKRIPLSSWIRTTGIPSFQISSNLQMRLIQVDFCYNEDLDSNREIALVPWEEFFDALVQAHGEEPLVHPGVLRYRLEALDGLRS